MKLSKSKNKENIGKSVSFDEIKKNSDMKRVELEAVEFDWIFKGEMAIDFIQHLATTENDALFSISTIRIIIMFLWSKIFFKIRNKIFYPFILYFISYIIMTTIIFEKKMRIKEHLDGTRDNIEHTHRH
jgi:hypothetical protein